jgi:hypothetical protein
MVERILFESDTTNSELTVDVEPLRRLVRVRGANGKASTASASSATSGGYLSCLFHYRQLPNWCTNLFTCDSVVDGGNLYTWGRGKYGSLGHGDDASRKSASPVTAFNDASVAQIASGSAHVVAVDTSGRTWCKKNIRMQLINNLAYQTQLCTVF